MEFSVAPSGLAVNMTKHYPGSVSDLTICEQNLAAHQSMLAKSIEEQEHEDYGEGASDYPGYWAVLVDKGYQGLQTKLRTIQPKRQPRGGSLTVEEINRNGRVSSDRVIVENFFGRMCSLWSIMRNTYTWNEDRFDMLARLCCALTNYHINLMPMRATDQGHYQKCLSRYVSMAHKMAMKRKVDSATARARKSFRSSITSPTQLSSQGSSQGSTQFSSSPSNNRLSVLALMEDYEDTTLV